MNEAKPPYPHTVVTTDYAGQPVVPTPPTLDDRILKEKQDPIRLNLGAGATKISGFTPIDRKWGSEVYPLEYEDETVDEMRASHILEHFHFSDSAGEPSAKTVLRNWVDKLKVGGRIRISVPNFDRIVEMRGNDPKWPFYLMGGQTDPNDVHKSIWTEPLLEKLMEECSLSHIRQWESDNTDTASHPCSINLEGVKVQKNRIAPPNQKDMRVQISALMSVPRYGANASWGCIVDALIPFKIPVRRATGAYWGQCLQNMMEQAVDDGLDWVLTIDYDSLFTKQHVDKLLGHFGSHPEIDALAAIQAKRGDGAALATLEGTNKVEIKDKPVRVTTAHFGLTLIRLDALKDIPKPWFFAVPNVSGSYDRNKDKVGPDYEFTDLGALREWANIDKTNPGRIDQDIWFWHQFKQYGKTVALAPDVRIGHLEETVLAFNEDLETEIMYMDEWRSRNGMHKETKR